MERIFKKEQLYKLLEKLSDEFEVVGPKELPDKGIFYRQLAGADELYLGPAFTTEPVKKFFLEPSSWLFRHSSNNNEYSMEAIPASDKKRIIVGVRSCEARALVLLDKVFDPSASLGIDPERSRRVGSEYKDEFYINNRNRTIIVGLACSRPDRSCFCVSMGGSPVEARGTDVLLFESGNGFIAEITTDKGKELIGSLGEELSAEQREAFLADKQAREVRLETNIKVPDSLDSIFGSDYWLEVSRACISCGVCTYLCPSCHCFDLIDEERKRLRCYDGCAFADFTLEASGENPRQTKKERYRQRAFHKFDFFKRNFGENLCVGCGRCIRYCPVKIDISEIVDKAPLKK